MKIYLDNCCFNRPFDDQSKIRIHLETEAKLFIQKAIVDKKVELVWSYILDYENSVNPFEERKTAIARWKRIATVYIRASNEIVVRAEQLAARGIGAKDALHVSCAVEAGCDWFLTTDDILLNRLNGYNLIAVANPVVFISRKEDVL